MGVEGRRGVRAARTAQAGANMAAGAARASRCTRTGGAAVFWCWLPRAQRQARPWGCGQQVLPVVQDACSLKFMRSCSGPICNWPLAGLGWFWAQMHTWPSYAAFISSGQPSSSPPSFSSRKSCHTGFKFTWGVTVSRCCQQVVASANVSPHATANLDVPQLALHLDVHKLSRSMRRAIGKGSYLLGAIQHHKFPVILSCVTSFASATTLKTLCCAAMSQPLHRH